MGPFLCGLSVVLALAAWLPWLGKSGGPLRTEWTAGVAVAAIFLMQGLGLPLDAVRRGISAWKVHLFCQGWMFLAYPLLGWAVVLAFGGALEPAHRIGLLYLCFLPTTIATNAAFSAKAGGNAAVAMFNIVAGNLIGVFVAPAALSLMVARGAGAEVDARPLLVTIAWQILAPFAAGQVLRARGAAWAARRKAWLREAGTACIFFILFAALCNLFASGSGAHDVRSLAAPAAATLALLALSKGLCWGALRALGWPREYRVSAFYSASQKTLAAGLPMAGAVYAAAGAGSGFPPLALVAFPLVFFHLTQLLVGALLVPALSRG